MKILKVYDKINRNIFQSDMSTGDISIREYYNQTDYFNVLINTRIFKTKRERLAYFSYANVQNGIAIETLDITSKHIFYSLSNASGLLVHSERIHLKDNKSISVIDRIYDPDKNFIESEKYRGRKTIKFGIKNEVLHKLLNTRSK